MSDPTPGAPAPSGSSGTPASASASAPTSSYAETVARAAAARARLHPERNYTGPRAGDLPNRTPAEAEKYFARLPERAEPPMPRLSRAATYGGWIVGGFACVYMVLFADFGPREHVFSPIRRQFDKYTNEMFTLSQRERSMMGLDQPRIQPAPKEGEQRPS